MNNYQYLDREPRKGDIVEMTHNWSMYGRPEGSLALVNDYSNTCVKLDPIGKHSGSFDKGYVKVVATKPGSEAEPGDTCFRVSGHSNACPQYSTFTAKAPSSRPNRVCYESVHSIDETECVVLCKQGQPNIGTLRELFPEVTSNSKVNKHIPNGTRVKLLELTTAFLPHDTVTYSTERDYWYSENYKDYGWIHTTTTKVELLPSEHPRPEAPSEQPTPTKTKEEPTMKITANLLDILALLAQEQQTDLEAAPKTISMVYTPEGKFIGASDLRAEEILQTPQYIGHSVRTYSFKSEMTTKIPTVVTKQAPSSSDFFEAGVDAANALNEVMAEKKKKPKKKK